MRPIAYALFKLQGNSVCMGDIVQWIFAVEHNLQDIGVVEDDTKALRYCEPVKLYLISCLESRFHHLYDFSESANDYIIATVNHPT